MMFQQELDDATLNRKAGLTVDIPRFLRELGLTISVAESGTQGQVAAQLSALEGSESFFLGSILCEHPRTFVILAGIQAKQLQSDQSQEVLAEEMAVNIRKKTQSSIGLSVVGSYMGFSMENRLKIKQLVITGSKQSMIDRISQTVLSYLRQYLYNLKHFESAPMVA